MAQGMALALIEEQAKTREEETTAQTQDHVERKGSIYAYMENEWQSVRNTLRGHQQHRKKFRNDADYRAKCISKGKIESVSWPESARANWTKSKHPLVYCPDNMVTNGDAILVRQCLNLLDEMSGCSTHRRRCAIVNLYQRRYWKQRVTCDTAEQRYAEVVQGLKEMGISPEDITLAAPDPKKARNYEYHGTWEEQWGSNWSGWKPRPWRR